MTRGSPAVMRKVGMSSLGGPNWKAGLNLVFSGSLSSWGPWVLAYDDSSSRLPWANPRRAA